MKQRKISRRKVHAITTHFCEDIPASKAAALVGVNRNTVNDRYMRFRLAIFWWRTKLRRELVGGEVEVDESYHGAKRKRGFHGKLKRGRGTQKQPVFGIFERNGAVFTEIVPDCKKQTLQALICGQISKESVIYSDGWRGYNGLVDVGYDRHFRVNHGENEFSKGNGVHINGIESFWSFTKRRLRKFNGLARHTFDLHLKECEWRWKKKSPELMRDLSKILRRYDKLT
jgi:transposase-like protein